MFTGIIEQTGQAASPRRTPAGYRLIVDCPGMTDGVQPGASIAVNGVCLTVESIDGARLSFDVVPETVEKSTLSLLRAGESVNLERALRVGDRLDGHFVQGHVDAQARVVRHESQAGAQVWWFTCQPEHMRYIVPKGSVAVDGISLTVAEVRGNEFSAAIVPTTLSRTNIGTRKPGDLVNIETDILVRTIVHQRDARSGGSRVTIEKLREYGMA